MREFKVEYKTTKMLSLTDLLVTTKSLQKLHVLLDNIEVHLNVHSTSDVLEDLGSVAIRTDRLTG